MFSGARKVKIHDFVRDLGSITELTEDFESIETPEGFRDGVHLYPHQATVVKALLDIEDRRVLSVRSKDFDSVTDGEIKIQTSAMVLSEPFGSGKTYNILALILLRPVPRAYPEHVNSAIITADIIASAKYRYQANRQTKPLFRHEITRKFTGPDALIRPNLIVVGSSVLLQWENTIKSATNLKCFSVGDYYRLQDFYKMYQNGKIKAYDIILLKNGKVTGNFLLPGEDPSQTRDYRSLISVVGKITAGSCWSRVIYDDFDTISIPPGSCAINALFTIYVSATVKTDPTGRNANVEYSTIAEAISKQATPLNLVVKDRLLFENFNVRNTPDYVETSTRIPIINGYRYVYNNPDDNYIRLLGAMGEDDADNIMEMLNGDAIGTAAEALGIKTNSVADIFQRMLDKKYEKYLHDQYVLELLKKFRAETLLSLEEHPDREHHSATELEAIRSQFNKKIMPNAKYYSISLDRLIDELTVEYEQAKEQDGLAINRVIDNIKEGECQICRLPLEDFDTFIVRCCGLIVCDVCGIKGNQIQKRYDYKIKGETLCGSCANCKSVIYPQTDLIFVDRDFDMESILNAKGDEKPAEPLPEVAEEAVNAEETSEEEIRNPKLKALRAIIRGEAPENCEEIAINIKHLLQGRVDIPPPADQKRKVLVFANYNETLNLVENFLVEQDITFLRLGGTYQEKANTVKKFHKYGQVLLINSQQHCAGLNLQNCSSDLVFMHKILDSAIESQVAGRIQRVGRECNARIHYLCYRNESARF